MCVEKVKMPLSNMGKIKDYFQPLNNLVVSPPAPQSEGKRIPLILSPFELQCDSYISSQFTINNY